MDEIIAKLESELARTYTVVTTRPYSGETTTENKPTENIRLTYREGQEILKALKRQRPKKPIFEQMFRCPECKRRVEFRERFCPECGQEMTWI